MALIPKTFCFQGLLPGYLAPLNMDWPSDQEALIHGSFDGSKIVRYRFKKCRRPQQSWVKQE